MRKTTSNSRYLIWQDHQLQRSTLYLMNIIGSIRKLTNFYGAKIISELSLIQWLKFDLKKKIQFERITIIKKI